MKTLEAILFGAVGASIMGGIFSFINMIISKENKVTEFRQNWIDNLRKDMSCFLSEVYIILRLAESQLKRDNRTEFSDEGLAIFRDKYKDDYARLSEMYNRVLLSLTDPDEYKELIALLKKINDKFFDHCHDIKDIYPLVDDITTESTCKIKIAWEKVKEGESTYVTAKNAFGIVFLLLAIAAIGYLLK